MAVSAATAVPTPSTTTSAAAAATGGATITKNFTTFLELLTTQLKNQNPLQPLDTNQFTQQLVQFAQVEQQINMNTSLGTMISLQQASQTSAAMGFLGNTVRVDGNTTKLAAGQASWAYAAEKAATATFNVQNSAGELVYTENRTISAGQSTFAWNGRGSDGRTLPDGDYKISINAKDASGNTVAVSTEVEGVVDGIDLSKNPPVLSVGGQTFTVDKIKQVRRAGT